MSLLKVSLVNAIFPSPTSSSASSACRSTIGLFAFSMAAIMSLSKLLSLDYGDSTRAFAIAASFASYSIRRCSSFNFSSSSCLIFSNNLLSITGYSRISAISNSSFNSLFWFEVFLNRFFFYCLTSSTIGSSIFGFYC